MFPTFKNSNGVEIAQFGAKQLRVVRKVEELVTGETCETYVFFSYATPIVMVEKYNDGRVFVKRNTNYYSRTTDKHHSLVNRVINEEFHPIVTDGYPEDTIKEIVYSREISLN
jgi:hypothetical protein